MNSTLLLKLTSWRGALVILMLLLLPLGLSVVSTQGGCDGCESCTSDLHCHNAWGAPSGTCETSSGCCVFSEDYVGSSGCYNTNYGATDNYGDDCSDYMANSGWCGDYDDDDFSSYAMCCACGGGAY